MSATVQSDAMLTLMCLWRREALDNPEGFYNEALMGDEHGADFIPKLKDLRHDTIRWKQVVEFLPTLSDNKEAPAGVFAEVPFLHLRQRVTLAAIGGEKIEYAEVAKDLTGTDHGLHYSGAFVPKAMLTQDSVLACCFVQTLLTLSTWDGKRKVLLRSLLADTRGLTGESGAFDALVEAVIFYAFNQRHFTSKKNLEEGGQAPALSFSPANSGKQGAWAALLLGQLVRGQTGVVSQVDKECSVAASARTGIAAAFLRGMFDYMFPASASSTSKSVAAHDFLMHEVWPTFLTQTGYEWAWEAWDAKVKQTGAINNTCLLNLEGGNRVQDPRALESPMRTLRDLVLLQLHGGTTFLERINASLPRGIRVLVGKMPEEIAAPETALWGAVLGRYSSSKLVTLLEDSAVSQQENLQGMRGAVANIATFLRLSPVSNQDEVNLVVEKHITALPCVLRLAIHKGSRGGGKNRIAALTLVAAIFVVTRGGSLTALLSHLLTVTAELLTHARASGIGHQSTSLWVEGVRLGLATQPSIVLDLMGDEGAREDALGGVDDHKLRFTFTNLLASTFLLKVFAQSVGVLERTVLGDPETRVSMPLLGAIGVRDLLEFHSENLCQNGAQEFPVGYHARHLFRSTQSILKTARDRFDQTGSATLSAEELLLNPVLGVLQSEQSRLKVALEEGKQLQDDAAAGSRDAAIWAMFCSESLE